MKRLIGLRGALLLFVTLAQQVPAQDVRVHLDRGTGTTIQTTGRPWVLALEQPHLAAHARDYVALHPVEISNAGKRRYFLAVFYWSTVPGNNRHAGLNPTLRLLLDDRDLRLTPLSQSLRDAGLSVWPLSPPARDALLMLYETEPQLLRQLGYAGRLRVRPEPDSGLPPDVWFESWRDARPALRSFAEKVLPQS